MKISIVVFGKFTKNLREANFSEVSSDGGLFVANPSKCLLRDFSRVFSLGRLYRLNLYCWKHLEKLPADFSTVITHKLPNVFHFSENFSDAFV